MSDFSKLVETAKKWADRGFQIVPLKLSLKEDGDKKLEPFYKWKSEPYPGFEKLDWTGANAYGIVLGSTEKGWLAYVDVDLDAAVKTDPFTTLMRAFPELQNTYIEKTPHGFHIFLYIDKPSEAKNINVKPQRGLELHVSELAIMAPSSYEAGSYSVYHEAEPVKISDFYEQFSERFAKPQWFNLAEKPKEGWKGPARARADEVTVGCRGSEGVLGSPPEEKTDLSIYMQFKAEKVILRVPLVKLAKIILDNPNPEPEELKSLNQKLSKIAKTRLGLKVVKDRRKRSAVEIPWGLTYKPSAAIQPTVTPSIKVIELDDKHPLEKQEPIVVSGPTVSLEENEKRVKVWDALAEASLTRGSAFLDELVQTAGLPENDVKAILEQFQREGKAYSPYPSTWKISQPPEKVEVKAVAWFGLTAKITSWEAWKATELLHWLKRDLPLDLEFPDGFIIKVRGALTWFLAKLKAVEHFGDWRKRLNLTRDSTLPGCIGLGKPIPPNTCETCKHHADYTCEQLKQMP